MPLLADASYLFISSPASTGAGIYYSRLLSPAEQARGEQMSVKKLSKDGQVSHPLGVAVDSLRKLVYVADAAQNGVVALRIFDSWGAGSGSLALEDPVVVVSGVEVHGVAVNAVGTLFVTDVGGSRILSISAKDIVARLEGHEVGPNRELYSFTALDPVKAPQGVAVDGYRIFWTNSHDGEETGALVSGLEDPTEDAPKAAVASNSSNNSAASAAPDASAGGGAVAAAPTVDGTSLLASNTQAAYGVCTTSTLVFYTSVDGKIYAMGPNGGQIIEVNADLQQPRGCVYDGDGTVFVADKEAGVVQSFSGGAPNMEARPVHMALTNIPDAYGLAVYISAALSIAKLPLVLLVPLLGFVDLASMSA